MKLASRNGVKVVLNGQGSDETWAGYTNYFHDYWYTLLRTGQPIRAWKEMRAYATATGSGAGMLFLNALSRQFHHQLRRLRPYRRFARWRSSRRVGHKGWFTASLIEQLDKSDAGFEEPDFNSVLRRSVERTPLPHYLRMEDRNSMAHGVEARLPFLDYRLVSLAFRVPAEDKMRGAWNKSLLRDGLRGRIPESVRTRPEKMGFPTSLHTWLTSALAEPLRDILTSQTTRERGIYNVAELLRPLQSHHRVEPWDALRLFGVAQFELWHGIHADRAEVDRAMPQARCAS
jgi:asparagine synthase (glutamine-hydrolysing)